MRGRSAGKRTLFFQKCVGDGLVKGLVFFQKCMGGGLVKGLFFSEVYGRWAGKGTLFFQKCVGDGLVGVYADLGLNESNLDQH